MRNVRRRSVFAAAPLGLDQWQVGFVDQPCAVVARRGARITSDLAQLRVDIEPAAFGVDVEDAGRHGLGHHPQPRFAVRELGGRGGEALAVAAAHAEDSGEHDDRGECHHGDRDHVFYIAFCAGENSATTVAAQWGASRAQRTAGERAVTGRCT
jgi:hypothetical protein